MNNNQTNNDIHLLAGAYALDAVDDLDRARFERHLATCDVCQTEVAEMAETLARVGEVEATPPPPEMRSHVLAQIASTPQALPATHMTETIENRPGSRRSIRLLAVAAAVFAIGFVGAGLYGYQEHQTNEQIVASNQLVTDVMTASDAQIRPMKMGTATSAIVMSPSKGQAVMVAQNVPALPSNQVYELWTVTGDGKARPAGTWTPNANGSAAVPVQGDLTTTAAVAVTVEPTGGSAQPTSKPIGEASMA